MQRKFYKSILNTLCQQIIRNKIKNNNNNNTVILFIFIFPFYLVKFVSQFYYIFFQSKSSIHISIFDCNHIHDEKVDQLIASQSYSI